MHTRWMIVLSLCVFVPGVATAAEAPHVAVPQFRNGTSKPLRISGSDLAKWMASELQATKKFEPVDRDALNQATKDATWSENHRFSLEVEDRLRELPADYILYGHIHDLRVEAFTFDFNEGWDYDQTQVPKVLLEFSIRMVDLRRINPDQEFLVHGDAIGDRTMSVGPPPYEENDPRLDIVFQQAARQALKEAARILAAKRY